MDSIYGRVKKESTPGTDSPTRHQSSSWRKKSSPQPAIQDSKPVQVELDANLLKPGITGVDPDLPLFDGLSIDPADHLIDLDTDSMERCSDVRVYFWTIGNKVQRQKQHDLKEADIERPIDNPDLLMIYDDKLVKEGRKYLKESRTKKQGWYLSRERDGLDDYLEGNQPGNPWHRFPTLGLVERINGEDETTELDDEEETFAPEDSFFDVDCDKMDIWNVAKTNIRLPMVWVEAMKEGIVQGTRGWDSSIASRYSGSAHPAFNLLDGGYTDYQLISILITYINAPPHRSPCDTELARQIVERDFSHLKEPVQEDAIDPQEKAELRAELMSKMSTLDDWIKGKPELRRKTFLGIPYLNA